MAVWTEVFGFKGSFKTVICAKNRRADLAKYLVLYFAVVVVQVYMWCVAKGALFGLWDGSAIAKLDRFERTAMLSLIGLEDSLEV